MRCEVCFECCFELSDSLFEVCDTFCDSGGVRTVSPSVPSRCSGLFGRVAFELARGSGDGSGTGLLGAGSFCCGGHALFLCERRGVGGVG
jgi:hypothetical protein